MLEIDGLNYWAVLVVWLVYLVVGAWWYSPAGFAKKWTKLAGNNIMKIPTEKANRIILAVSVSGFLQTLTLGVVLNSLHVTSVYEGLVAGLVLWLGLTAATTVGVTLYSLKSWSFLWLNSSYFLVVMSIGSVIFAAWQ